MFRVTAFLFPKSGPVTKFLAVKGCRVRRHPRHSSPRSPSGARGCRGLSPRPQPVRAPRHRAACLRSKTWPSRSNNLSGKHRLCAWYLRHRLGWRFSPDGPGPTDPAAPLPASAHHAAHPRASRDAGEENSLLWESGPCTCDPLLLTRNWRRKQRWGTAASRDKPTISPALPPVSPPPPRTTRTPRSLSSQGSGWDLLAPSHTHTVQGKGCANKPHQRAPVAGGRAQGTAGSDPSVKDKRWRNE
ncbi:uncharacterized protein LOC115598433 [Calypte anna]|uniref:uncharacterized protein LOC115598433 n=1 Tax=Calypte anna TaxID=9244 RepID=UPI0011C4789D|nr:uncharacterized protein LOC115598433 [Calypte anna]